MITTSAFEVLGPIMVGPSSSHTAGALRIALVARSLAPGEIRHVDFKLYNSFSRTHIGHGTDKALVAGILGLAPDDIRVRNSFVLAQQAGLSFSIIEGGSDEELHPNTVEIAMQLDGGDELRVLGESVGGGRVRIRAIDDVHIRVAGELPTIFVSHYDRPGVLAALTGILGAAGVNIATMRSFRDERGGKAYTVFEVDEAIAGDLFERLRTVDNVIFASMVLIPGSEPLTMQDEPEHGFANGQEILELCADMGVSIGELMRRREIELEGGRLFEPADARMDHVLDVMDEEVRATLDKPETSLGGFLHGQAKALSMLGADVSDVLMGGVLSRAVAYAMAVLERSASMGVIVAAPTAGSAGVVPGAVLAVSEALGLRGTDDRRIKHALWNSAAIGAVIAANASVSGAEGGCQAEVGAAAAMAASALVELLGGAPEQCLDAASIAISNLLGLVCDPVQGMVEHPCQNRNAIGVTAAVSAAQLVLAGIRNPIPFDEVVAAMAAVGEALPSSLRETAEGGLAATPTACASCPLGC